MKHKIFGIKENVEYLDREGAYFIPFCNGKIGIVETPKGYFLIGGGIEKGETHSGCIERECIEEAGYKPIIIGKVCSAESYLTHSMFGYFHPIQTYYFGEFAQKVSESTEKDHKLLWLSYEDLKGKMFAEMQNFALDEFMRIISN